ncbi:SCO family protein [Aliihoeflea sp. PC F10.4]
MLIGLEAPLSEGDRVPVTLQFESGSVDVELTVRAMGASDAIGGPFDMVDDSGKAVTEADLIGKPSAIFFGFTYCPDVCPTTLFELSALIDRLGPDADRMNFVMVTVDPQRDTPEILHEYVTVFDKRIRGARARRIRSPTSPRHTRK